MVAFLLLPGSRIFAQSLPFLYLSRKLTGEKTTMNHRRVWICVFLFTLTLINYTDRVALSVAAKPISAEFGLSPPRRSVRRRPVGPAVL